MKLFLIVLAITLVKDPALAGADEAADYTFDNISTIIEKASEDGKSMTQPPNKFCDEGLKAAQQTSDTYHSKEFQERIQGEQQRIEKELFPGYLAPWKARQQTEQGQQKSSGGLPSTEKIYLFFSSSVPDETIQTYIADIAGAGDPNLVPVMRGWPGGVDGAATKQDANYFSKILQKESACQGTRTPCEYYQVGISLQPALFAKYAIARVPAVVYENDTVVYRIQGDAGLDYLLERINREAKSDSLNNLITTIRSR